TNGVPVLVLVRADQGPGIFPKQHRRQGNSCTGGRQNASRLQTLTAIRNRTIVPNQDRHCNRHVAQHVRNGIQTIPAAVPTPTTSTTSFTNSAYPTIARTSQRRITPPVP